MSLFTKPSSEKITGIEREDCLSEASFAAPGYFEQHREVPQDAGPSERLHFLIRFCASKNECINN